MASISKDRNGNRTIQFVAADKKRRSIRLGKMSHRQAESIKTKVEALNAAAISKCPLDNETAVWVGSIGDDLADKLAAVGLIPRRSSSSLEEFIDKYIERRTDAKPNTIRNFQVCGQHLVNFFGGERDLRTINSGDADSWVLWLKERYADGTVSQTLKRAKQVFKSAVRNELITKNPFADITPPSQVNESRKAFVSRDTIEKILRACPNAEWRLIVALCRYGGLRCPSELLPLRWDDVNWEQNRFRVTSPKTEHHEGGGERWVPLFPELRPYLEDAFDQAEEGTAFLINRYRTTNSNLRTQLDRICRKAGVSPWPKRFQNLRATRETELAAEFPLHVVCAWIGNSALVAQKHYLQVTEADFEKASKSGAESGAAVVQNPVQPANARICQEETGRTQAVDHDRVRQILSAVVNGLRWSKTPPEGIEPSLRS